MKILNNIAVFYGLFGELTGIFAPFNGFLFQKREYISSFHQ
ncbi:MAG: hypothetical protein ACJAQ0_001125 [Dasania sp.]|jgi:hypothetical protein